MKTFLNKEADTFNKRYNRETGEDGFRKNITVKAVILILFIFISVSSAKPFGNIRRYRNTASPNLAGKAIDFLFGKRFC